MQPHNSDPVKSNDGNGDAVEILTVQKSSDQPAVSTQYSSGTGLKLGITALVVATALSGAFFLVQHRRARRQADLEAETATTSEAPMAVDIVSVKYSAPTQTFTLPGETRAWYETSIYARVSGYVANWSSDIGDSVKAGDVLARIDTPELDDQLAASRAKLKVSEAEVAVMQSNSVLAKSNYDRWSQSPKGVVSDLETEEKKAEAESSLAKLKAAESQVNLDEADVKRLVETAAFQQVRAPFDGVITARHIDIGDLVTAGSTASTTSLYSIAQYNKIRVFIDVPQSASVGMTPGTPAIATAAEFPGQKFEGKVARTSQSIDQTSRTLRVEVDIPNPDLKLLPGMYVQVAFEMKENSLLQIPASALVFKSSGPRVAVVEGDGSIRFHDVTIASDQGEYIEIGSGLSANDKVALNISNQIADGDHVNPIDTDKPVAAAPAGKPLVAVLAH